MPTPTSHTPSLTSPQMTTLLLAITPLRMNVSPVPGMLAHELPALVLLEVEVLTLVPPAHGPSAPEPPEQLPDKLLPKSKTPTPTPPTPLCTIHSYLSHLFKE